MEHETTAEQGPATGTIDASVPRALLVAAILAPGLVVFVLPMVSLISRNEEYFGGAYSAGRWPYVAGALTIALGVGLWALRRTSVGRIAFVAYLLITPAYLVYSLLSELRRSVVLAIVGVALVAAAVWIARSRATGVLRSVAIVSAVILVANGAAAVLEAQNPPADSEAAGLPTDENGRPTLATAPPIPDRASGTGLPNVYHVILDEFQSDQFEGALTDQDREALRGFTYFPNASTTYGRTEMAVADMFAEEEYDYSQPTTSFVHEALLGPTSSIQRLRAAGYDTTSHMPTPSLYAKSAPFDNVVLATKAAQSDPGADYADLATSMWIDATLPDVVTQRVIPESHYEQLTTKALLPDDEPETAVAAFHAFLNRERQLPATGRYTLLHLMVPHRPYVLNRDCERNPDAATDPEAQAGCALDLMDQFIAELRDLGRFDSSTIVIQGDHGAGVAREGDHVVNLKPDYFGIPWSTGRSRPLILVKPAGTTAADELATSDRPAMITDVIPTIFDSVDLPFDARSGRASLLAADFPERPERYYHFYDKGDHGLPDGKLVRFVIRDGVLTPDGSVPVPMP